MAVACGLSLRPEWISALLRRRRTPVETLEVMIDDLAGAGGCAEHPHHQARLEDLRRLGRRWPLLAHGVHLGIGGAEGLDPAYLDAIAEACASIRARWYTEHMCFVRAGGVELGHFVALEDDPETLAVLERNAARVRARVRRPFLLENPADILGTPRARGMKIRGESPGHRLGRSYSRCLHAAKAGALLDLTNVLYDARNGGWPMEDFFSTLDFERVVQIHLAGGFQRGGLWIDSHARPVETETHALLAEVAARSPNLRAVIVEWDEDLPALDTILDEVELARSLVSRARAA